VRAGDVAAVAAAAAAVGLGCHRHLFTARDVPQKPFLRCDRRHNTPASHHLVWFSVDVSERMEENGGLVFRDDHSPHPRGEGPTGLRERKGKKQ